MNGEACAGFVYDESAIGRYRRCKEPSLDAHEAHLTIPLCASHQDQVAYDAIELVFNLLAEGRLSPRQTEHLALAVRSHEYLKSHPRDRPTFVYFARSLLGSTLIKIGVSGNVPARMRALSAEALVVVESDDAKTLERDLHRELAVHREHGEWFRPEPEIFAAIERLRPEVVAA